MDTYEYDVSIPASVRREQMLMLIRDREFVSVSDLSARFGISEVTVRSDLDALAGRGYIRRVRGGAVGRAIPHHERPFEESQVAHADEKTAIGRAAAALVSSDEAIILDVGTTTTAVARALAGREDLHDVVVFTNALNIAFELEPAIPRLTVILTGGTLRPLQHSLVDPLGTVILEKTNAHTVFLGCNGVDPEAGITNINMAEAEVKRQMLRAARRHVVVADGSKIGSVHVAHLCDVKDVDLLITDPSADPAVVGALEGMGLEVHSVS